MSDFEKGGAPASPQLKKQDSPLVAALKNALRGHTGVFSLLVAAKALRSGGPREARRRVLEYRQTQTGTVKRDSRLSREERSRQESAVFPQHIKISILVPLYNTPEEFLRELIASVQAQTYGSWELCLADGSDESHAAVGTLCRSIAEKEPRIVYRRLESNEGISGNTNRCAQFATGEYFALLDHDDLLHPAALYHVMQAICDQGADYVYTDEAAFEAGKKQPIFSRHVKPDFAPDNLLANNYICHLSVFRRELFFQAGGFRSAYDGSQDHDLFLRLTAAAQKVVHVPRTLYYWRSHPQSVASDISAKTYAVDAARRAVRDYLRDTRHVDAQVDSTEVFPTIFRITWPLEAHPLISILIPVREGQAEDAARCLRALREKTGYDRYEIVLALPAGCPEHPAFSDCRRCAVGGAYSPAVWINRAAQEAAGEYLLLLDPQAEVLSPDWLERMLMYAQRRDVGAVGAKLYGPEGNRPIRHAGIALGDPILYPHEGLAGSLAGYMGRPHFAQDVTAVSGACLMLRKALFDALGGLEPGYQADLADVDMCLRLRQKGLLNVFTPFAELNIARRLALPPNTADARLFRSRWAEALQKGDPYYRLKP